MSQRLTIDLKKNPEVADLIADMEVGSYVNLSTSIVAKDEQTLTLELEEATTGEAPAKEEEEEGEPTTPAEKVARGLVD